MQIGVYFADNGRELGGWRNARHSKSSKTPLDACLAGRIFLKDKSISALLFRAFNRHEDTPQAWEIRFFFLLGTLFLWRILYVIIVPLDLVPDEAYYWDWSRILDWGYYSKPPLIAWIIALSTHLLGNSAFAVRLPAVILSTAGLWGLYLLARQLYGPRVAFWSAAAAAASPGASALALIMTIDAPLVCFWCLALYTFWQAINAQEPCRFWWICCAACLGLGFLSKQMMLVFPLLAIVFLLTGREDRRLLRKPWFYITLALALLPLIPVFWWNIEHGSITIRHTMHHFEASPQRNPLFFVVTLFDYLGSQMLLISPITCFLFAVLSVVLLVRFPLQDRKVRFLLVFSIVPLLVFVLMSLRQRINPNWPAAFYPAGIVLFAAWAFGPVFAGTWLKEWRKFSRSGIGIGTAFAVLTYAIPFVLMAVGMDGGPLDPAARMKGWQQFGKDVGALLDSQPQKGRTLLIATERQLASELAFYVPGQPRIFKWKEPLDPISSQYDIWPGPFDKIGCDALVVLPVDQKLPPDLAACFRSFDYLGGLKLSRGQGGQREYNLYAGYSLHHWP